jgi:hypothetical protein
VRLLDTWLADPAIREAAGVNSWEGVVYVDRDRLERLLRILVEIEGVEGGVRARTAAERVVARLRDAAEATGYRVERMHGTLTARPRPARTRSPR